MMLIINKLFKCTFPNCQVTTSKWKSNLKRPMKNCETEKKRRGNWTETHALIVAELRFHKNTNETDM